MSQSTTFSDSPPSSPNPCIDSSPPSSPSSEPAEFAFKEPYSGSHNLTRPLRTYDKEERKSRTRSEVFDDLPRKRMKFEEGFNAGGEDDILVTGEMDRDDGSRLGDEELWEMETTKVVEEACGLVDLNGKGLSSISLTAIHTLQSFFVTSLNEEREHAAAIAARAPRRTFSRTSSQMLGIPREEVRLFLARNAISHLPTELFDISKLTVLAMPHNNLHVLPPEISRLRNLQTLNVSSNKLQSLPSEIQQLSLSHLTLAHNPFLHPTKAPRQHQIFDSVVPPLSELCLRLLIKTGIMHYDVPPTMVDALHNCLNVPPSRPPSSDHGYKSVTGLGKCVCGEAFVLHAEECLTWETKVAGCHVGESVPLKWRGCTVGCLVHLVAGEEPEAGVERDPFEGDWSEDIGFRPIQFGGLRDDFDDE